jgi:hypothetical protein
MASMKALVALVCLLLVSPALATDGSGSGSGSGDSKYHFNASFSSHDFIRRCVVFAFVWVGEEGGVWLFFFFCLFDSPSLSLGSESVSLTLAACDCLPCEVCVNGVCEVAPQGHVCAESQGPCEVNATCDGSTRICARAFRPLGHICRSSTGGCDQADVCTGDNETCPDNVRLAGEICRNSSAPCEEDALCDGSTTTCPANEVSTIGKFCGLSQGPCEANATCSGLSVLCPRVFLDASAVCRAASGSCDEDDLCSGSSPECTETVKPSAFECRSSTGPCEQPANCDGSTKDCPANLFVPGGVVCDSRCDVNYTCSGSSVSCPSSPAPCSSHGSCSVNTCVCSTGFSGPTCDRYCAVCSCLPTALFLSRRVRACDPLESFFHPYLFISLLHGHLGPCGVREMILYLDERIVLPLSPLTHSFAAVATHPFFCRCRHSPILLPLSPLTHSFAVVATHPFFCRCRH